MADKKENAKQIIAFLTAAFRNDTRLSDAASVSVFIATDFAL